jgi:predicted metal-dependent phosphotriesterase family hydrolase
VDEVGLVLHNTNSTLYSHRACRKANLRRIGARRRGTRALIAAIGENALEDDQVVAMVMSLIDAGYADHLMFSSDLSNAASLKRNNQELGYAKTLTVFVPKVKKAGASEEVLPKIMNDNPRRLLAFVPKVKRKV